MQHNMAPDGQNAPWHSVTSAMAAKRMCVYCPRICHRQHVFVQLQLFTASEEPGHTGSSSVRNTVQGGLALLNGGHLLRRQFVCASSGADGCRECTEHCEARMR